MMPSFTSWNKQDIWILILKDSSGHKHIPTTEIKRKSKDKYEISTQCHMQLEASALTDTHSCRKNPLLHHRPLPHQCWYLFTNQSNFGVNSNGISSQTHERFRGSNAISSHTHQDFEAPLNPPHDPSKYWGLYSLPYKSSQPPIWVETQNSQ